MTFLAVICNKTHSLDLERFPSHSSQHINCGIISIMSSLLFARGPPIYHKNIYDGHHPEKKFWSFKHLPSGNAKFVSWEKKIVLGKTKVGEEKTEPISDCERTKMEKVLFVGGGEWGGDNKGQVTGVLKRSEIQDYLTSRRSSSSKILDGGPNVTKSKSRVSWVRSRLQGQALLANAKICIEAFWANIAWYILLSSTNCFHPPGVACSAPLV